MTIVVYQNGSQISSEIHFVTMSPWSTTVKYKLHEIDGANFDIVHITGKNSPTTTLTGVCRRTSSNCSILEGMKGNTLTIVHSEEGSKSGVCVSLSSDSESGTWVTFSMMVINQ